MCWLYDIEAAGASIFKTDISAAPFKSRRSKAGACRIKLTDLEMLVGNLYAAKDIADKTLFNTDASSNSTETIDRSLA
jgi:hypothetical protein